jgi:hypothetical protein
VPDCPAAAFTPDETRKVLAAAPRSNLPLVAIGAFAGIRTAEHRLCKARILAGRVESPADEDGKKFAGYVADLTTWIGLQCVNKHSAVRIKNLGIANGTTISDDLAFGALAKGPAATRLMPALIRKRGLAGARPRLFMLLSLRGGGLQRCGHDPVRQLGKVVGPNLCQYRPSLP